MLQRPARAPISLQAFNYALDSKTMAPNGVFKVNIPPEPRLAQMGVTPDTRGTNQGQLSV